MSSDQKTPSKKEENKINVKTEVFEGPLDLLLHLIEKRKLFINDISLAKVTEDYIDHVNSQSVFPMSQASHFIYISSTLLLIKSKSLLPDMELTEEEESDIEDLEYRLRLYRFFKELSKEIQKNFGSKVLFAKKIPEREPVFSPDERVNIDELNSAAYRVINNLPGRQKMKEATVERKVRLNEVIENLRSRISSSIQLNFKDFYKKPTSNKADVVVNFMALLELVKSETVNAYQDDNSSDILLEARNISVPRYDS